MEMSKMALQAHSQNRQVLWGCQRIPAAFIRSSGISYLRDQRLGLLPIHHGGINPLGLLLTPNLSSPWTGCPSDWGHSLSKLVKFLMSGTEAGSILPILFENSLLLPSPPDFLFGPRLAELSHAQKMFKSKMSVCSPI